MAEITAIRKAGDRHRVLTVEGAGKSPCQSPCATCPWRVDAVGVFPAEAFLLSAPTAYNLSQRVFSCHTAGADNPRTCAGFLLRGAQHNLAVRMKVAFGELDLSTITDGGNELHADYRSMAIANGCNPDDPALTLCR